MSLPRRPLAPPTALRPDRVGRPSPARATGIALSLILAMLAAGLAIPGCSRESLRDPLLREPALLIDGAALARVLERVRALAGTPAGAASARLLERLKGCAEVAGHFAEPASAAKTAAASALPPTPDASLGDRLVCRDDARLDPALVARLDDERGEHAGILQWPLGAAGRLVLQVDVDPAGGLVLGGSLDDANDAGPIALFLPSATAPADAAIDPAATLLHLRLRPAAGLRLAELIPQGSQGDRLFALKGRLLEGALLEGTVELAFLPPAPGGSVPLALLALHHRAAGPIETALAEAHAQLERTWGIVPTARRFEAGAAGAWTGGCYADLPILPELAPCWVVTENALLVGYRAEALESALARTSAAAGAASGLVVDLERVRALDEALAGAPGTSLAALYSRLELRGRTDAAGRVVVEGELRARP
jgi:hypothetical protein